VQIARLKVAGAINCKIQEVYFTSRRNRKW
jgi:hypothetical protein